jgi:hypothetical protein
MSSVVRLTEYRRKGVPSVYFTRNELNQLLSIYSRRVIGGEWKDYAIDQGRGMSAFSIYKSTHTQPAYTIYKYAKGSHRRGDYVVGSGGNILNRSKSLGDALSVLDRQLRLVGK